MRFKGTVLLLGANILLLAVIWMLSRADEQNARSIHAGILPFDFLSHIQRIRIEGTGMPEPRVVEKRGHEWLIKEPIQWHANYFAIQNIFSQLQFFDPIARFAIADVERGGNSLADYGLETPSLKLVFSDGHMEKTIAIGQSAEIANHMYLMGPDGKTIYTVKRSFVDGFLMDLAQLRNEEVFEIPMYEVKGLAIKRGNATGAKVMFSRSDDHWEMDVPIRSRCNDVVLDRLIGQLLDLKVESFLSQSDVVSRGDFGKPVWEITLEGHGRTQTLQLVKRNDNSDFYDARFKDNATPFTLDFSGVDLADDLMTEARDRRIADFNPERVDTFVIEQDSARIALQQLEDGSWQVLPSDREFWPKGGAADGQWLFDLLKQIHALRAVRFVSDAPSKEQLSEFGLEEPRKRIELRGARSFVFLWGSQLPDEPGLRYLKLEGEPHVYAVMDPVYDLLELDPLAYKERTLPLLREAEVLESVALTQVPSGELLFDQCSDGLLAQLSPMQVARFVPANADGVGVELLGQYIPWFYRLELGVSGASEPLVLFFTKRLGGDRQLGILQGYDKVFILTPEWLDWLSPYQSYSEDLSES